MDRHCKNGLIVSLQAMGQLQDLVVLLWVGALYGTTEQLQQVL